MSTFDYALMLIGVGVIAAALSAIFESRRKNKDVELCRGGYAPNSERIPPEAWIGAAVFVAIFIGLFDLVGSAVFVPK